MTDIVVTSLEHWYGGMAVTARCRVRATGPLGDAFYDLPVSLSPTLLASGASATAAAAAVATALNVDPTLVSVAGQGDA